MEIIGRLTHDAKVETTKSDRQVVKFTIAINYTFKANGKTERGVSYVNCAYWQNTKVAEYLRKGSLVKLYGRMSASAHVDMQGEVQPVLNFFTKDIEIIAKSKKKATAETAGSVTDTLPDTTEDLPF